MDSRLNDYSMTDISDEKKRSILTHIIIIEKKQEDYIPDLIDWCQSTSLFTKLEYISDFLNIMIEMRNTKTGCCLN